ncbi:MAG: late competence development ComFB family protein [Cuspidothrix sp.]
MSTLRPSLPTQYSDTSTRLSIVSSSNNVMELLVTEEVYRQIQLLPPKIVRYIKAPDVVAYALNRLPSLYATSKRGWQRQLTRAKTEFKEQIHQAVHQAIVAVQIDPLRESDLIQNSSENNENNQAANAALEKLKIILQREDLSWENVASIVEQKLANSRGSTPSTTINNYGRPRHSTDQWDTYRY